MYKMFQHLAIYMCSEASNSSLKGSCLEILLVDLALVFYKRWRI
jgi:hypothetical protein